VTTSVATTDHQHRSDRAHGPAWRDPLTWVVAGLLVAPLLIGIVAALLRDQPLISDFALIDLRTRDVGSDRTPLVGPYSRFLWNHPGPLMFWVMRPFQLLFGGGTGAIPAAVGVIGALTVTTVAWGARRVAGRRGLLLVGLFVALLCHSLGDQLLSPWNPWIAVLPFVLVALATWAVMLSDLRFLPILVLAASFVVQSHVGYGVVVAALCVLAAGTALTRAGRREAWRPLAGWGAVALGVGLLVWSGPIVEQLTTDPGNMTQVIEHFAGDGEVLEEQTSVGMQRALGAAGRQLHPLGPWLTGDEPVDVFAELAATSPLWALPVLAALALTGVGAWRRRQHDALALHASALVVVGASTLSVASVDGDLYIYLIRFWWVAAMWAWLAVAWAAWRWFDGEPEVAPAEVGPLDRQIPAPGRPFVAVGVAALVLLAALTTTSTLDPIPQGSDEAVTRHFLPAALEVTEPGERWALHQVGFSFFAAQAGLLNLLDADGVDATILFGSTDTFGPRRVSQPGDPDLDGLLLVAVGADAIDEARVDPALQELAIWEPLTDDERAELARLQDELRAQLVDAGRADLVPFVDKGTVPAVADTVPSIDRATADRVAELLGRGDVTALFVGPPP
jgi:hypothetical protein